MITDDRSADVKLESTPIGKVMGVVENRNQLRAVCEALSKLGVQHVEVCEGPAGIEILETWQDAVAHCFLGDMEAKIIQRSLDAVKNGWIAFAAAVDSETADQAAEAARTRGASQVAHFGNVVITNY